MDIQEQEVARPADLARYEETVERQEQREYDEAQQNMEPPYAQHGTPMQLDEETRRFLSESGNEARDRTRGRSTENEDHPALAKLEVRMDHSPGRQSVGWESAPSRRSGHSKDDLVTQRVDMDDRELVPDYSGLPSGTVPIRSMFEAPPLAHETGSRLPETLSGSQIAGGVAQPSMEAILGQMSGMMSRLVNEQLAPTLNQMMLQQARVESRLEALEMNSRPMSVAGEANQERAILDADEAISRLTLGSEAVPVQALPESRASVGAPVFHSPQGESSQAGPDTNVLVNKASTGVPGDLVAAGGMGAPTEGVIVVGGIQHAWSIGVGGLKLQPLQGSSPDPKTPKSSITPGDVFTGRAGSPFERVTGGPQAPSTDPRSQSRAGEIAGRALRATTSEPSRISYGDESRNPQESGINGDPKGWVEKNRRELEELLRQTPNTPPLPPKDSRAVTPVRPRIVYPFSPGGTEIKPPPLPRSSPKRSYRSSPSPPRSPPGVTVVKDPAPPEGAMSSGSEIRQLANMLGEAIRGSRGSEGRVEDVKAIPELPKLEIKESERELSPLIAGDWITMIGPSLRDLSASATAWWSEVLEVTQSFYERWIGLGPMERLVLSPDRPDRFASGVYTRVEPESCFAPS